MNGGVDFGGNRLRSATIISEFYSLRRTAIKDIAAYLGFLVGFIGSAPFAWGLLAVQLDAGRFARGLWYFFGIVTTAGIFAGIAGMGLGVAAGLLWEQLHRYRRAHKPAAGLPAEPEQYSDLPPLTLGAPSPSPVQAEPPRLQLVTPVPAPVPNLTGRRISSVRFSSSGAELDFGGLVMRAGRTVTVATASGRYTYPESGSRDALCGLIDTRVTRVRAVSGDRVEVVADNGDSLFIPRSVLAGADGIQRRINEF